MKRPPNKSIHNFKRKKKEENKIANFIDSLSYINYKILAEDSTKMSSILKVQIELHLIDIK